MEIAVKETYAHMLKDESLVQNAETLYIVEFLFDKSCMATQKRPFSRPAAWSCP